MSTKYTPTLYHPHTHDNLYAYRGGLFLVSEKAMSYKMLGWVKEINGNKEGLGV